MPGTQSEGFVYNVSGNPIFQTNFNGVVITNQYDEVNRLTNCSSVGYQTTYAYSATGLRTNMTDASGATAYAYNAFGQLTNKTVMWTGGPTVALTYDYDALGAITNIQSSTTNGVNLGYNYDSLGRLTNVLSHGSSIANYGFDGVGNLQTMGYANGLTNLYQYDARNRLTNETIQNIGSVSYMFDTVGNRKGRTSTMAQLPTTTSTYTANDWLQSDRYDNNGNTLSSAANSYQYDVQNHLTNFNNGQVLIAYDGDGNRVKKTVGGATTYYLLDDRNPSGYVQVLEELQGTTLDKVYDFGLNLISQEQGNALYYFILDGHDSTRILTDGSGSVQNVFAYDSNGTLIASNGVPQTAYLLQQPTV